MTGRAPENLHARLIGTGDGVSILTQPEGWVPYLMIIAGSLPVSILTQPILVVRNRMLNFEGVSILTQPEGWVP